VATVFPTNTQSRSPWFSGTGKAAQSLWMQRRKLRKNFPSPRPDEIEVEPRHVNPDPVHVEKFEGILAALPKIKKIVTMIESVSDKQLPPSE